METYWYCTVVVSGVKRGYSYISDMGALPAGTLVQVPFGSANELRIGKVRECGSYSAEAAPYPVEKTKHILRLATAEEHAADDLAHRRTASASAGLRVLSCPQCGAPLPEQREDGFWICGYCDSVVAAEADGRLIVPPGRKTAPPSRPARPEPTASAGPTPKKSADPAPSARPAQPPKAPPVNTFEVKARVIPEERPTDPVPRRRSSLHPLLLAAALLVGMMVLFLPRHNRRPAAPVPAATPKAVYRATPSPSPSPRPSPEIPYFRMMEDSVEKTLLGPAVKVTEPLYPWKGYWDEEEKQTEYWFGTEDFPCFFAVCMLHIVVDVRDYRSEPRPDLPYVGMPEEWVQYTGLGEFEEIARESSIVDGRIFVRRCYVLCSGDRACFTVVAENGYVSQVGDLRDAPIPRSDLSDVLPSPLPADPEPSDEPEEPAEETGNKGKATAAPSPVPADRDYYDNPEDLWFDYMDEFEDFDEAAEYWEEEYG